MISKIILVISMAVVANCFDRFTPSSDTLAILALSPTLNSVDLLDGPASVSNAPTMPTANTKPSLEQMMYYNYYAASMYCQYQLNDLSCEYCKRFKKDVYNHTVLMNNNTDTTALVAVSKIREEIVVVYRGTANIWNTVLDFVAIAARFKNTPPGIKLHAGFYSATMSLYKDVVTNVGFLRSYFPNYKIVVVGHSLGAAMARITQFFFLTLNQFPGARYELYTYGEPRSGNKAFANYMNAQTITSARVVASADIVPHVAPTSVVGLRLLGDYYVHSQTEYWINGRNNQRFCSQHMYEDPTCSNSLGPAYSLVHHGLYFDANYAACLIGQPAPWAAIPLNIFQPVGNIPPLPDKISNFLGAAGNFGFYLIGNLRGNIGDDIRDKLIPGLNENLKDKVKGNILFF